MLTNRTRISIAKSETPQPSHERGLHIGKRHTVQSQHQPLPIRPFRDGVGNQLTSPARRVSSGNICGIVRIEPKMQQPPDLLVRGLAVAEIERCHVVDARRFLDLFSESSFRKLNSP